jgi:hypothetical protein
MWPNTAMAKKNKGIPTAADPKEIFELAEAFCKASRKLDPGTPGTEIDIFRPQISEWVPGVTLEAFSLELYFKCLLRIDGHVITREHDYRRLYNPLGVVRQATITKYFKEFAKASSTVAVIRARKPPAPYDPDNIDSVIDFSKDAFESFRYIYEPEKAKTSNYVAADVRQAIRKLILELNPNWV